MPGLFVSVLGGRCRGANGEGMVQACEICVCCFIGLYFPAFGACSIQCCVHLPQGYLVPAQTIRQKLFHHLDNPHPLRHQHRLLRPHSSGPRMLSSWRSMEYHSQYP